MDPIRLPEARRREAAAALRRIAATAGAMLAEGASALEVVESAVSELEDCPLFNAGRGAVLTASGRVELDASIMDGRDRSAGAVAAVTRARNPIRLARWVREQTPHVLIVGPAADALLAEAGLPAVEPDWFVTAERRHQLALARAERRVSLDHDLDCGDPGDGRGTVGAVARDRDGHLAAATSTGGMTNQRDGRVGDTPLIGAGTWADDRSVCVSATGHGEFFIRCAVAHAVHARCLWAGQPLDRAAEEVLAEVSALGGEGGLIAIDRHGRVCLRFSSPGMYRAWIDADGELRVGVYREPE